MLSSSAENELHVALVSYDYIESIFGDADRAHELR